MSIALTTPAPRLRRALVFLLIVVWCPTAAFAATASDSVATTEPAPAVRPDPAVLTLENREIAVFRAAVFGYVPAQRIQAATVRLREAVDAHPRNDPSFTVDVRQTPLGWLFHVDGRAMFGIVPGDLDPLGDETIEGVVSRTKANLESAIAASLEQRTTSRLVRSVVYSVLATILLVLSLRALSWLGRRVNTWVHNRVIARAKPISETHVPMFRQLGGLIRAVLKVASIILALVLVDVWLTFVLKQFPYTYPWGDQIDDFLFRALSTIGLGILRAVPNLVILALILLIGRFVVKWVKLFFGAVREGRIDPPGVDAETAIPVQRLVILFVWVVVIAIAYPFIPGSQGIAFKGLSVLLGVMLSLGSSNVVSQAASGYMIMFSRALRTNDYVRIGDYEGTIMSVGMLSTKLRTARDEEINVPNSYIVGTTVKNYTRLNRDTGAPVSTAVTIGYNAPWRQVHAMLLEAAAQTSGLRREPAPRVLQTSLSDFYVEYTLLCRLDVPQARFAVLSDLHANIQDIFNVHGVQIMSPHYEGDPDGKVWVPKEKWYPTSADEPSGSARVEKSKGSS